MGNLASSRSDLGRLQDSIGLDQKALERGEGLGRSV
jgi:hypothetical protein